MSNNILPIQFIGTQRSGSNLLRLMLNQTNEIFAPHPPHILKQFYPILMHYGNLADTDNYKKLIEDVCRFVELNPVPWMECHFDRDEILKKSTNNSIEEVFRLIYETNAKRHGVRYWCCKSMVNVNYYKSLENSGIKPFYIHLYRDGRDVALSFKKAIVGEKHAYFLAKKWNAEQKLSNQIYQELGSKRVIQLSYEDLISEPEESMKRVCEFLNIEFNENVLDYYKSEESNVTAKSGRMWKNLVKPILKNNFNKYKKELSIEDVDIFERVAGDTLSNLGFKMKNNKNHINDFSEEEILNFENKNNKLKNQSYLDAAQSDKQKRLAQEEFINEIKTRIDKKNEIFI
jgi:hypothetical protein